MPSPIAVLTDKLFEVQRIGKRLASRYWRKEAEALIGGDNGGCRSSFGQGGER